MLTRLLILVAGLGLASCTTPPVGPRDGGNSGAYSLTSTSLKGICFGAPPSVAQVPREPSVSVGVACGEAALDAPADQHEALGLILGRWQRCSATPTLTPKDFAGLEFSPNGLFTVLAPAADGGFEARPDLGQGSFDSATSTQIDVNWDGAGGVSFMAHYSADRDAVDGQYNILGATLKMARLPADPLASSALPPSKLTPGACPLFGVWDTVSTTDHTRSTVLFGDDGQFVGCPVGGNACLAPSFWGTFWLETDLLTLVRGEGFSPCGTEYSTDWTMSFSPDCQDLTLNVRYDACTGARPFLTSQVALHRESVSAP